VVGEGLLTAGLGGGSLLGGGEGSGVVDWGGGGGGGVGVGLGVEVVGVGEVLGLVELLLEGLELELELELSTGLGTGDVGIYPSEGGDELPEKLEDGTVGVGTDAGSEVEVLCKD
jgi:hypothetical protein